MSSERLKATYWLVCVPENKSKKIFDTLEAATRGKNLCTNFEFNIPANLRVGTLDDLYTLSDDLDKIEIQVEAVVKRIGALLVSLTAEDHPSITWRKALQVDGALLEDYAQRFAWNEAKYPYKKLSCRGLTANIASEIGELDLNLKKQVSEFNTINQNINAREKKQSGSLSTRSLSSIVKDSDLIFSEYLTTLLIVVPNHSLSEWEKSYERDISDFGVVPRSSKKLFVDTENSLYSVTIMRHVADTFRQALLRGKKFMVREYDPTKETDNNLQLIEQLKTQRAEHKSDLIIWCNANFAEAFVAWVHLKAIRVFVESVLRYGLPANFRPILILPHKEGENKSLRKTLFQIFQHLGSSYISQEEEEDPSITGMQGVGGSSRVLYPYVCTSIAIHTD